MYPVTARTTPRRLPERMSYDRAAAHAILDEAYLCHLGFSTPDGPCVLPTLFVRVDDTVYVHGSTGSGPMLALSLREVSVKARSGGPREDDDDLALPHWAGVLPLRLTPGVPVPSADATVPVPAYLRPDHPLTRAGEAPPGQATRRWHTPVVMRGRHVVLEPLDVCHAAELFAALDDAEVHRYIPRPRPTSPDEMAAVIAGMLREHAAGLRVPWVQRDAGSGAVIGTTSYCPPDEHNRSVHIGSTQLGRAWWRTGANTEAKLMLMTRAFEQLGAVRVEWQTDLLNLRSQAAIERLGATREGVLRRHKRRGDGTWRDSVFYGLTDAEWPATKQRLTGYLGAARP